MAFPFASYRKLIRAVRKPFIYLTIYQSGSKKGTVLQVRAMVL